MKIYTKTGDSGTTSLIGGERTSKDDLRVEAYGTVDELNAFVAYLRDGMMSGHGMVSGELHADLRAVLSTLMEVQAAIASAGSAKRNSLKVNTESVVWLEGRIDMLQAALEPVQRFTIPGGHPLVSLSHICRTVCRRAERCVVRASREFEFDRNATIYLNRLSDYLYALGRTLGRELDAREEYWES